ncbi:hypothetical protein [uncultured Sphaerochaeta sp.]|uniref:hypothetical protein n=1 Tax=uncultured Sphaerochaeta sp. TaxID=886478 RepID=UPI002A0A2768|nr:hypothetical protein [uncultured Sphaerochaeta sp.]
MNTDLPTLGAATMFVGLAIGFFLCFYGTYARKWLLPLRSVLSGAFISLGLALLVINRQALLVSLAQSDPFGALERLFWANGTYIFPIIYLLSFSLGGLLLFYFSRKQNSNIGQLVKILTGLSMALVIFLLLRSLVSLPLSILFATICLIFILYACLKGFDYYFAVETSLAGGLLVSYLITRFWYLSTWMFIFWSLILTALGILTQIHSIQKGKERIKNHE